MSEIRCTLNLCLGEALHGLSWYPHLGLSENHRTVWFVVWILTVGHQHPPTASSCSLLSVPPPRVCLCLHFVASLRLFSPLPICWRTAAPSLPPLPPFLSLLLAVYPPPPPPRLLPPCSLIPPSLSLFGCHLVSYVRGMGGERLWCLGAIRLTSRHSLALPRVVCCVAVPECCRH